MLMYERFFWDILRENFSEIFKKGFSHRLWEFSFSVK